jgi:hypothetical protein
MEVIDRMNRTGIDVMDRMNRIWIDRINGWGKGSGRGSFFIM